MTGKCYFQKGLFKQAEKYFKEYLKIMGEEDEEILSFLGNVYKQ